MNRPGNAPRPGRCDVDVLRNSGDEQGSGVGAFDIRAVEKSPAIAAGSLKLSRNFSGPVRYGYFLSRSYGFHPTPAIEIAQRGAPPFETRREGSRIGQHVHYRTGISSDFAELAEVHHAGVSGEARRSREEQRRGAGGTRKD